MFLQPYGTKQQRAGIEGEVRHDPRGRRSRTSKSESARSCTAGEMTESRFHRSDPNIETPGIDVGCRTPHETPRRAEPIQRRTRPARPPSARRGDRRTGRVGRRRLDRRRRRRLGCGRWFGCDRRRRRRSGRGGVASAAARVGERATAVAPVRARAPDGAELRRKRDGENERDGVERLFATRGSNEARPAPPDGSIIVSVASTAPGDDVANLGARHDRAFGTRRDAHAIRTVRHTPRKLLAASASVGRNELDENRRAGRRAGASAVAPTGNHRRKTSNNPHFDDCLIAPPYRSKKTTLSAFRHTRSCRPISTIGPDDAPPPKASLSVTRTAKRPPRGWAPREFRLCGQMVEWPYGEV